MSTDEIRVGLECMCGVEVNCEECSYSDKNGHGRSSVCKKKVARDALKIIEEMQNYKEKAVDIGYLYDWYQGSVMDDPPVWTDEHIKELYHDFYCIPKPEQEDEKNDGSGTN